MEDLTFPAPSDAVALATTPEGELGDNRETPSSEDPSLRLAQLSAQIAALEQALAQEHAARDVAEAEAGRAQRELAATLGHYRALLLTSSEDVPEELVQGETISALDESFRRAKALVERLRGQLEAAARKERVPPGAPQRQAADFSSMTPHQKILLGLQRKAS